MTKKELEEAREWEFVLHQAFRIAKSAKKKLVKAFGLMDIRYDEEHDEVVFLGNIDDDGFVCPKRTAMYHIDEMIQIGWVDIEEEEQ